MTDPQPLNRRRRIFLSSAASNLGQAILRLAGPSRPLLTPHVAGSLATPVELGALTFDLRDRTRLETELKASTTVIHLPDESEPDTTRALIDAAAATRIEQFILLSASGAGRPIGGYLKSFARAEALLLGSSLRYTIVRPSFRSEGEGVSAVSFGLSVLMGRRSMKAVSIEDVALTLLDVAVHQSWVGAIIEGEELQKAIAEARLHAPRDFAVP